MLFRSRSNLIPALLGGALAASSADAVLAQSPNPAGASHAPLASAAGGYEIKGFRSALFGMTQAQVRVAAAADFGAGVVLTENANPAEGTQTLQLAVDHLEPGPGPAQVIYIFGARSKTLSNVNVVWTLAGEPTADQRASIVTAGVQLTHYFETLPSPPKPVAGLSPTGPNSLIMFAALDAKGAGVQIAADGISYQAAATADHKETASPPPRGPAMLRVSYAANATNPDIVRIKPGSF